MFSPCVIVRKNINSLINRPIFDTVLWQKDVLREPNDQILICVVYWYYSNANLQLQSPGSCGAFAYGQNTTDYASDGYFDDAAITVWNRGTTAEVIWKIAQSETTDHHRGKPSLSDV